MNERSVPRAPSRDGAIVAVPPLRQAGDLLSLNRQRLHDGTERFSLLGRPFAELRRAAREAAVGAASRAAPDGPARLAGPTEVGAASRATPDGPARLAGPTAEPANPDLLFVAGHQPELFHPGVWVKNFALCGLARAHGAMPLNLIIDNDTVKSTAVRLPVPPSGREDRPHLRSVRFDRWTGETPYEERTIADRQLFADFAARAGELLRGWNYQPMLADFWAEVLRQAERTSNLGECFAAARRTFERVWGCHNLEVPLSTVCDTEPFAWFACHLLANLPQFHSLYNEIVADYRRHYRIRSRNHPVPDLAVEGDWLETPLWGWRNGSARRGRLFARLCGDRLELRVGADSWPTLPAPQEGRAESAVQAWQDLRAHGYKIRTRALITTLYARLFLGDLFIHGIGGGTYDELTDELMRRFYGCEPPEYIVLSATRWLPLPRAAATADDRRRLLHELRDVHYNPQRHLDGLENNEPLSELVRRKQKWIGRQPPTRADRRERFRVLRSLTDELRQPLRPREEQLRQQLVLCQRQLRANAVLQRRDYAFCLFPVDVLRPFCCQFLTAYQSTGNMHNPDYAE